MRELTKEFMQTFKEIYTNEYNAYTALCRIKNHTNKISLKKFYKLSDMNYNNVIQFYNYIQNDIIPENENIENNYIYILYKKFNNTEEKETTAAVEEIEVIPNKEEKTQPRKNIKFLKIEPEKILEVKHLLKQKCTIKVITEQTGVSSATIYRIKRGYYDNVISNVDITTLPNIDNTLIPNKEEKTQPRKNIKFLKIEPEKILEVKHLLAENITISEIHYRTKISLPTIYKVKNGYYDNILNDIEKSKDEVIIELNDLVNEFEKEKSSKNTNIDINNITSDNNKLLDSKRKYKNRGDRYIGILKCGLIKFRHPMPTNLYIFENALSANQVLDYEFLNKNINKFIDEHVPFDKNGNALCKINLLTSGLQSALSAVIKACAERKIGLDILHYDSMKGVYTKQKIFEYKYNSIIDKIEFNNLSENIYINDIDKLLNSDKIYELRHVQFDNTINDENCYSEQNIFDNLDSCLELYTEMVSDIILSTKTEFLTIREYVKRGDEFKFKKIILHSHNTGKKPIK